MRDEMPIDYRALDSGSYAVSQLSSLNVTYRWWVLAGSSRGGGFVGFTIRLYRDWSCCEKPLKAISGRPINGLEKACSRRFRGEEATRPSLVQKFEHFHRLTIST